MALINCPECGKSVSDTVKKCPHCGFTIRKSRLNKKIVIISILGTGIGAFLVLGIWALVVANFSLKPALSITFGEWGCLLQHTWEEATCQHPKRCKKCGMESGNLSKHNWEEAMCSSPKKCSVCGETVGEPLEHQWEQATCEAPKTCVVCGKTEGDVSEHTWEEATCTTPKTCKVCNKTTGSAVGHTTRLGKCAVCGDQIYDLNSEALSILQDVALAMESINDGYYYANQSADSYFGYYCNFCVTAVDFSFAKTNLHSAINTCGSYEEFAELKRVLTSWENAIPADCKDSNSKEVLRYDKDLKNFLELSKQCSKEFTTVVDGWGYE